MYEYHRDVLKDNTPEAPTFESDMPRNYHGSRDVLNIHHAGKRSKVEPIHSEMYIGNTTRDNRGAQTEPDMNPYREGLKMRIKNYKDFLSDATSDQSIAAPTWSDPSITASLRGTWKTMKKRMRWFETSISGKHQTHNTQSAQRSKLDMISRDDNDRVRDLDDVISPLYTPGAMILGGQNKVIGRRMLPSHRFKVAKYGQSPKSHLHMTDPVSGMGKSELTTNFARSEVNAHHTLAIIMAGEASKMGRADADPTTDFGGSSQNMTGRRRVENADVRKSKGAGKSSQDLVEKMVMIMDNTKTSRAGKIGDHTARRTHQWFDPDIYEVVKLSSNISVKPRSDPFTQARNRRMALTEIDGGESMLAKLYAVGQKITPQQIAAARNNGLIEYDAGESATYYRGKSKGDPGSVGVSSVDAARFVNEAAFTDSATRDRLIGPMGTKSAIRRHVRFEPTAGLETVETHHARARLT
jgi:hypothetical protein